MARKVTPEERERARLGGEWLREERRRRGYDTGTEFAAALGLRQGMISVYENGQKLVDRDHAALIAALFGMSEWEVWLRLRIPLPAELDDDEAIRRAFQLRPDVMGQVPEIVERVTGEKPLEPPPFPSGSPSRRTDDTRKGERRQNSDPGRESAV